MPGHRRSNPDRPVIKVLFVLSCVLIGGAVLFFAGVAAIDAVFLHYARHDGIVRAAAPVYAATDEQSLLRLENAEVKGEDLAALAGASDHHIVLIAPKTRVSYKSRLFYDGQKLSRKSNNPSARPVLLVKVLTGLEKGHTVWIAERDVGFYAAL